MCLSPSTAWGCTKEHRSSDPGRPRLQDVNHTLCVGSQQLEAGTKAMASAAAHLKTPDSEMKHQQEEGLEQRPDSAAGADTDVAAGRRAAPWAAAAAKGWGSPRAPLVGDASAALLGAFPPSPATTGRRVPKAAKGAGAAGKAASKRALQLQRQAACGDDGKGSSPAGDATAPPRRRRLKQPPPPQPQLQPHPYEPGAGVGEGVLGSVASETTADLANAAGGLLPPDSRRVSSDAPFSATLGLLSHPVPGGAASLDPFNGGACAAGKGHAGGWGGLASSVEEAAGMAEAEAVAAAAAASAAVFASSGALGETWWGAHRSQHLFTDDAAGVSAAAQPPGADLSRHPSSMAGFFAASGRRAAGSAAVIPSFAVVQQQVGAAGLGAGRNLSPGVGCLELHPAAGIGEPARPPLAHARQQQLTGGRSTLAPGALASCAAARQLPLHSQTAAVQIPARRLSQRSVTFLEGLVNKTSAASDATPFGSGGQTAGTPLERSGGDCGEAGGAAAKQAPERRPGERLSVGSLLKWPLPAGLAADRSAAPVAFDSRSRLPASGGGAIPTPPPRFNILPPPAGVSRRTSAAGAEGTDSAEAAAYPAGRAPSGLLQGGLSVSMLRRGAGTPGASRPPKSDRQSGWEAITRVSQLLQQQPSADGSSAAAAAAGQPPQAAGQLLQQPDDDSAAGGASVSVLQRGLRYEGDLTLEDLIRAFELRNAYDWDDDLSVPREQPQVACDDRLRGQGLAPDAASALTLVPDPVPPSSQSALPRPWMRGNVELLPAHLATWLEQVGVSTIERFYGLPCFLDCS